MPSPRFRLLIAAAWIALLVAVCLSFTRAGTPVPPDSEEYAEVARSLVRGEKYTINMVEFHAGFLSSIRHTPELHGLLQPFFLVPLFWLWGPDLALVRVPGLVLWGCLCLAVFWGTERRFGRLAAIIAVTSVVVDKALLVNGYLGSDDVGFALFCFVALLCFSIGAERGSERWFLAGAVLSGLATLQKVSGVILPLVAAAALLGSPRRSWRLAVRACAMVAAGVLCALAVYIHRNHAVHGGYGFRFSAIDWLNRDDPSAYYAFYPHPPTFSEVVKQLGRPKLLKIVAHEFQRLRVVLIRDSPLVLGGLVALIGVRRDRPWVFGALTYGLTTVLLTTLAYHVESRYLSGLLPIGAMTIGGALAPLIERAFDALRAKRSHGGAYHLDIRARRFAEVSGIAACAALTFVRTVVIARTFGTMRPTENSCTRAAEIIKREAASTSRVLTTNPWLVSWLADRPAIMAPTNGPNAMQAVLEYYKPEWILSTPHLYGGLNLPVELERLRETGTIDARLVFEGKQCSVYRLESATDDQSSEDL